MLMSFMCLFMVQLFEFLIFLQDSLCFPCLRWVQLSEFWHLFQHIMGKLSPFFVGCLENLPGLLSFCINFLHSLLSCLSVESVELLLVLLIWLGNNVFLVPSGIVSTITTNTFVPRVWHHFFLNSITTHFLRSYLEWSFSYKIIEIVFWLEIKILIISLSYLMLSLMLSERLSDSTMAMVTMSRWSPRLLNWDNMLNLGQDLVIQNRAFVLIWDIGNNHDWPVSLDLGWLWSS